MSSAASPTQTVADLLSEIEEVLRQQTQVAHEQEAGRVASLGQRSLVLLGQLGQARQPGNDPPRGELLQRLRDLAAYNQLLIQYAFTSFSADRLDRQRRAPTYNARGQRQSPAGAATQRGNLAKGVL